MPRFSRSAELPLTLHREQDASLPAQIAQQLRSHITSGTLQPSDYLPSTRELASRLNVARGSVVAAYEQLSVEGFVEASKSGTRVAPNLSIHPVADAGMSPSYLASDTAQRQPVFDVRPGAPDTSVVASAAWRSAWREAAAEPYQSYPASGSPALQYQFAEHLRTMRHTVCAPREIVVTAGARDGFRLLLTALRMQHRDRALRVAVENPGYPSLHQIPAVFGHEIVPVEVDEAGLNPASLPHKNVPDLVLVAPSHQYPLGASMPVTRRLELLEWAHKHNAYIVEDDYDSELRYVGDTLPALTALSRQQGFDRTVMLGSFSKTLTPALGLGFMLLPGCLTSEIISLRETLGSPVSALTQDAAAHFFAAGGAHRHIARMRRIYRRRRETLITAFAGADLPPWVKVLPMDGGLHLVLELTGEYATASVEQDALRAAEGCGVCLAALGDYWAHASVGGEGVVLPESGGRTYGLVLGFGAMKLRHLEVVVQVVAQILRGLGECEKLLRA